MGIDEEGMATVLSILSNMYSDSSLAVVREYSCNALDSQITAGNPEPILITAPTALNPMFTVQDFGLGLSHDEMLNVYAKYGASTKRGTNDQIGSFGIGAKSAFTIGTQFTVTAVKDGMKTVALFALNDEGAPTVNILVSDKTDEPNGVKVEIGV
jgi:HSP90 family molecular chaperone